MNNLTVKEAKNQTIYTLNPSQHYNDCDLDLIIEIEKTNLYDFVIESQEETTTPRGVGARNFIEKDEVNIDVDDIDKEGNYDRDRFVPDCFLIEGKINLNCFELINGYYYAEYWIISSWGVGGNRYKSGKRDWSNVFRSEEEAENKLFDDVFRYDFEKDDQRDTQYFESKEMANDIAMQLYSDFWGVNIEVVKSILKKRELVNQIKDRKNAETLKQQQLIEKKENELAIEYSRLIEPKIEPFKETATRLSQALNKKVDKATFFKAVKLIRKSINK